MACAVHSGISSSNSSSTKHSSVKAVATPLTKEHTKDVRSFFASPADSSNSGDSSSSNSLKASPSAGSKRAVSNSKASSSSNSGSSSAKRAKGDLRSFFNSAK
jgi:hypothetical protein